MADSDIVEVVHADRDVDSIYLSIHNLNINKQEVQRKKGKQLTPSIYRVQNILRIVNPLSYNPRVLSIGPFHKEDKNLKRLEAKKVSYVCNLFRRLNSPQEEAMKKCIKKVLKRIDQIKSCYEGGLEDYQNNQRAEDNNNNNNNSSSNSSSNNNNNIPNPAGAGYWKNNQLAEMMVIDGCFILEVIYASYKKKYDSPCSKIETKKYDIPSFIDSNLVSLYVKHDLILLENQIPFFVLKKLFKLTISLIEPNLSLVKLVLEFLEDINPFSEKKLVDNIPSADTNHDHILGLLQKCYQPMDAAETSLPDQKHQDRLRESKLKALSYSAADLSRAGVKFAPNKNGKSILTMEFKVSRLPFHFFLMGKPTFFMPVLTIEDYTESFFRNLIAYEQLTPATSKHITSYAFAMDCLLDSQEDVQKVIGSGVFVNNLGSTKDASDLFNSICKEVTVNDFSYEEQWILVNKYYEGYWPKNVAFLRRTYFSNPWSLIGLLAAMLLFALTVAQTYFAIYHPS